jgi:predicted flap endonuclease-1-like 5' DNA nuclease
MFQALGILFLGILLGLLIEWIYTALFVPSSKDKNKKLEEALQTARKENASLQRWVQKLQGAESMPTVNSAAETTGKKSEETVTEPSATVSESVTLAAAESVAAPIAAIDTLGTASDVVELSEPTPEASSEAELSAEPVTTPEVVTTVSTAEPTNTAASVPELTLAEVVSAAQADVVVEGVQAEAEDAAIEAETTDPALTIKPSAAEIAQSTANVDEVVDPATLYSVEEPVPVADEEPEAAKSEAISAPNALLSSDSSNASDFTKIHGIGPKLADLFKEAGVTSYKHLANMDINQIDKLFADNSMLYNRAVAVTWPQQAKLAEAGDWSALRKFKASRKK